MSLYIQFLKLDQHNLGKAFLINDIFFLKIPMQQ